jgi:hypothetical protein
VIVGVGARQGRASLAAIITSVSADRGESTQMKIAVVGKGNVGGGLADLWEKAGHDVQRIGSQGGDVTGADVVLIAIPGRSVPSVFEP